MAFEEHHPGSEAPLSSPEAELYHDRSTGLAIFGVMTIGLGCLSGLFVPLAIFGQAMSASVTHEPTDFTLILPALCIYGVLAVALIWLGIGSVLARRWARALLLIFSWSWLALGVVEIVAMSYILPKTLANLPANGTDNQPALTGAAIDGVLVGMFVVLGVVFVIMPGAWTFFYSSRHVKATCDARSPGATWTDACPLPVLAICLWGMFSVPMMVVMPIVGHGVAPFFGIFLTGWTGTLFYFFLAALWITAVWLMYRLDVRGWWLLLIALGIGMVSMLITLSQHNMLEMYRLMHYPEAQIEQIQKSGLLEGNSLMWMSAIWFVPFLGYLWFIKRYFRSEG